MSKAEIAKYYEATKDRDVREDLVFAAENAIEPKIAIDCGCGAGADIEYLLQNGFTVHGFDAEHDSISRCQSRFGKVEKLFLSQSTFSEFKYPNASLVVADASLFFCPDSEFDQVWSRVYDCLLPGGIFCGSLLGKQDSMAVPGDNPSVFWPNVTAFEEPEVIDLFEKFEVLRFNTFKSSGKTSEGIPHHWHIFQIVARKA